MKKFTKAQKFGIAAISIFAGTAILSIILHFINFGTKFVNFVNVFFIALIGFIISFILYLSTFGKWNKLGVYVPAPEEKYRTKEKHKFMDGYTPPERRERVKLKEVIGAICLFGVCGIAATALYLLGGNNIKKMHSDAYEKTTARIMAVYTSGDGKSSSLKYVYYDKDGNQVISDSSASWGGISFKEGAGVTIYYSVQNPEIIIVESNSIMIFVAGSFFLLGGLLIAGAILGFSKFFVPLLFGSIFFGFSFGMLLGAKAASGLPLYLLLCSGAMAYACLCFALIGLFIIIFSLLEVLRFLIYKISPEFQDERERRRQVAIIMRERELEEKHKEKPVKEKKHYRFRLKNGIGIFLFGLPFIAAGLLVMIGFGIIPLARAAQNITVEATVIEVQTYRNRDGNLMASYTYEYFVDGVRYEKESSYGQSAELAPTVGEKVKITYNKNNPSEIVEDHALMSWIALPFGLIFVAAGGGVSGFGIYLMREEVDENDLYKKKMIKEKK